MTKKIHILAAIIAAACVLATMTACSNGENSNNLSSDTVTTTVTDLQTPAPETTTEAATTTVTEAATTTEKKMEPWLIMVFSLSHPERQVRILSIKSESNLRNGYGATSIKWSLQPIWIRRIICIIILL